MVKDVLRSIEGGGQDAVETSETMDGCAIFGGVWCVVICKGIVDDNLWDVSVINEFKEKVGEGDGRIWNMRGRKGGEVGRGVLFYGWQVRRELYQIAGEGEEG